MQELDDIGLLRQYTENDSEEAFAAIVARHINKVYSVALRHTGNPHQAEEITQAVFVILAKKAPGFRKGVILSGWFYETARLTSITFLRSEIRRARRDQEAYMQNILNEPALDETWRQMAPLLDAAMAHLTKADRNAVVLRFFDGKSIREVGNALGTTEDTARKRVSRALEKLQRFFSKRGVSSTTAIISGAISSNSIHAAPATLAKTITVVAMAKGATASGSTLILTKGVLNAMAWTKIKIPLAIVAISVLLAAIAFDPWKNADKIYSEIDEISVDSLKKVKNYDRQAYQVASVVTNANGTITTRYTVKDKAAEHAAEQESFDSAKKVMEIETNFFRKIPQGVVIRSHAQNPYGNTQIFKDENHEIGMGWTCQQLLAIAYGTEGRNLPLPRIILPANSTVGEFDYLINVPDHGKEHLQAEVQKYFGIRAHFEMIETNALFLKMQNPNARGLRNTTFPKPNATGIWSFLDADGIAYELENGLHQYVVAEAGLTQKYWINLPWPGQWGRIAVNSVKQNLLDEFGLAIIQTNMPVKMLVVDVTNKIHIPLPAETEISEIQNLFKTADPWKDLGSVISNYDRIVKSNAKKARQAIVTRNPLSNKELTDQGHEAQDVYNDYFSRIRTGVTIRPTQFPGPNAIETLANGENKLIGIDTSFLQLACVAYGTERRNYSPVRIVLPPDSPKGDFDYCVNVAYLGRQSLCEQIRKQFGLVGQIKMIRTNAWVLKVKNPNAPSLQAPDKFPQTYTTVSYPLGTPDDMADIAYQLENEFFHEPVVDETQLNGQYWFYVPWNHKDFDLLKKIMMDHLGLELISTNMPVEMLVLEKAQ